MAGGKGTRISPLFADIPKPLIPIKSDHGEEKSVLEWEVCSLREQGLKDIIITVGYMADKIINYFGDGKEFGVHIEYFNEKISLGNAGALFKLDLTEDFLLINADSIFDIDFNRMIDFHKSKNAFATLFTHPNNHPFDSCLIVTGKNNEVVQWISKEDIRPEYYKNRVNAGIHIISPRVLELSDIDSSQIGINGNKVDLDRQILKPLCKTGKMFAYDSPEYVKDMGTPERYEQVSRDYKTGIVTSRNLRKRQKTIFLDRDGTINVEKGFLKDKDDIELIDGAAEAIKMINNSGYLCIIVTNQPVVARGDITEEQLGVIHEKLEALLGENGAYIDALYYCPHHPDKGFEGEIAELKMECDCRKPKPGMLLKASEDYNIDLKASWMIGDSVRDVKAGRNAGCHTAMIGSGNYGADIYGNSLREILDKVLQ